MSFRNTKLFIMMNNWLTFSEKEKMLMKSVEFAKSNRVEGDYFEFGTDWGESFILAYNYPSSIISRV